MAQHWPRHPRKGFFGRATARLLSFTPFSSTHNMADAEKSARDLVAAALKKASSGGGFFGSMFSHPTQKFEDASEMLTQAANQFKIAKLWKEAGETFEKAAEMQIKAEVRVFYFRDLVFIPIQ